MPIKASPTSPSVVLHAVKPEKTSAAVHRVALVATAIKEEKCFPLSAPLVAKIPRYLLSQEKGDPYTAANVTPKLRARPTFKNTKREDGNTCAILSFLFQPDQSLPHFQSILYFNFEYFFPFFSGNVSTQICLTGNTEII